MCESVKPVRNPVWVPMYCGKKNTMSDGTTRREKRVPRSSYKVVYDNIVGGEGEGERDPHSFITMPLLHSACSHKFILL